ncbi:hypothetical protein J31TS4_12670 [Paenibacillus sp. J31TS4]|nr:hypothetical protein J31TS4_12670 [Paenibacillus sp. J31TS4]
MAGYAASSDNWCWRPERVLWYVAMQTNRRPYRASCLFAGWDHPDGRLVQLSWKGCEPHTGS